MASEKGDSATGPWDVAMYLVQRFPVFALAVLLLGAGVYGLTLIAEEKNKAERELLEARQTIEAERKASRQALEELAKSSRQQIELERQQAAEAHAKAAEMEAAAKVSVATAKADALLEVQETLLTASERVQRLVLGQLSSVEDLEQIRARAAQELTDELQDLARQREEAETLLEDALRRTQVAKLTFAVDALKDTLDEAPYQVHDAIETVTKSFELDDEAALDEIKTIISDDSDPRLRGSLQYALVLKTSDRSWAQKFVTTLEHHAEAFGSEWFSAMFQCCERVNKPLWTAGFPAIASLVADDALDIPLRLELLKFFENRPEQSWRPLLFDERYASEEYTWKVVHFIIKTIQGIDPLVSINDRVNMLYTLESFDRAAAHVWASWLLTEGGLPEANRSDVTRFLENRAEQYPVFSSEPPQNLAAFWMNNNLLEIRGAYYQNGRSDDYGRLDE